MATSRDSRVWSAAAIALLIVAAIAAGIALVRYPGLHYDEVMFVHPATEGGLGSDSDWFVNSRILGLPVTFTDYQGAIKAWLAMPILTLGGVSVETVRIPMVIVFAIAVLLTSVVIWRYSRPWIAVVGTALLCADPVFALVTRVDWGPSALAGLLRAAVLLALLRWLESRRVGWLVVATVATILGTFNKLDFALFAGALLAASLIVLRRSWAASWEAKRGVIIGSGSAVAVSAALMYWFMYRPVTFVGTSEPDSILARLPLRLRLLWNSFAGDRVTLEMTGVQVGTRSLILAAAAFAVVVAGLVAWSARRRRQSEATRPRSELSPARLLLLLVLTGALELVGMIATKGVRGTPHGVLLWPLPVLLLAFSLAYVTQAGVSARVRGLATAAIAVAAATALVSQVALYRDMATALADPANRTAFWTGDTETLARLLNEDPGRVVVTDWGIGTQLDALTREAAPDVSVTDVWTVLRPEEATGFAPAAGRGPAQIVADLGIATGERIIVVGHTPQSEVFPGTQEARDALIDYCMARGGSQRTLLDGEHLVAIDVVC